MIVKHSVGFTVKVPHSERDDVTEALREWGYSVNTLSPHEDGVTLLVSLAINSWVNK